MNRPAVLERRDPPTAVPPLGFIDRRGEWQSLDDTPDEVVEASAPPDEGV